MSSATTSRAYNAARETSWWLRSRSFVDRAGGPEQVLFVLGSGRSGTTWVQELLNRHDDHRVMFEPFNPRWVHAVRSLPEHAYLTEETISPEQAATVERVLAGHVRSPWVDQMSRPMVAHKRLVKDIRAHGLIGYVSRRWPTLRVVYVVRHPLAVMASASALNWSDRLDRRLAQPQLVRDHLEPHMPYLTSLREPWERAVAAWCVDNLVVMRSLDPGTATLLVYEQAVADPATELTSVVTRVGQQADDELFSVLAQPSRMSRVDGCSTADDRVSGWQTRVDGGLQRRALAVVAELGFGQAFGADPLVRHADVEQVWSSLRDEQHAVG
jgi:hypothetical protein